MSSSTHEHTDVHERDQPIATQARWLHQIDAPDAAALGGKAANLARAAAYGFPVLPGFVVPTRTAAELGRRSLEGLYPHWRRLSEDGQRAVVVRSSSPVEDDTLSSMAGVFDSVVDVRDWPSFRHAFGAVLRSAGGQPMAVLVQRHLDPETSGVLFGVDPVTGRSDRRVVAAVSGGPWLLVSGEVTGRRTVLRPRGQVISADGDPSPVLPRRLLWRLARLAHHTGERFGAPQDIEWAVDHDGTLWLLQSRPITRIAARAETTGPRLGPGPVAETFPDPLSRLEADLWLPPLRDAIVHVLSITGAVPTRRIRRSPVVRLVEGRAVVDLDLIEGPPTRGIWPRLDPRPRVRRLAVAWRTGRLHFAFSSLAGQVLAEVDAALTQLPPLDELTDDEALRLLANAQRHLVGVHGHELLAARLGRPDGSGAAQVALAAVAGGRRLGWSDEDIVARRPIVLSLSPPRIGPPPPLPDVPGTGASAATQLSDREALRLRARWLHEVSARTALELGRRLVTRGVLTDPSQVNAFDLAELADVTRGALTPLSVRPIERPREGAAPPLPAVFRLTPEGQVVAEREGHGGAVAAAPGRAVGKVSHGDPADGEVLVVRSLDPALAAVLPRLAGLVSETGSPLSHLAILAREYGVPAVVGVAGALERFAEGAVVVVDGTAGEVSTTEEAHVA